MAGRLETITTLPEPFDTLLPDAINNENQAPTGIRSTLLNQLGWSLSEQRAIDLLWQWQQLQVRRDQRASYSPRKK